MSHRLAADLVVLLHFVFVLFVILGGLAALRRRWVMWLHLPVVVWGTLIELVGWVCPLTPLENRLRHAGGQAGYSGGFVEEYILPIVYPAGLTREIQFILGGLVVLINVAIYTLVWRRWRRSKRLGETSDS